jgi:hypothetical protein
VLTQELLPGSFAAAFRRRFDAVPLQDRRDCAAGDIMPEIE